MNLDRSTRARCWQPGQRWLRPDAHLLRLGAMTGAIFVVMGVATGGRFFSVPNFQSIALLLPELALLSLAMLLFCCWPPYLCCYG